MEKIRIIDLLNKVAKGEEMPKLVKYHDYIYAYDEELCNYEFEESYLFDYTTSLNNEVEVIEDNKKIEKIRILNCDNYVKKGNYETILTMQEIALDIQTLKHKINEIIDKLEELE